MRGRKYIVHIECRCPALACRRYRILGRLFWKPKDLENIRVNGLRSLIANSRLGIIPYPHFKIARRYSGTTKIYVSLGTIMEGLALFVRLLLLLLLLLVLLA